SREQASASSPMEPPAQPQKRKRWSTLRASDWEPHKERVFDLYVTQGLPLREVRQVLEEKTGFKAQERQYKLHLWNWGMNKYIKAHEMEAIVHKLQRQKQIERNIVFNVRDNQMTLPKIERWMKRHDITDSFLYAPPS
ncbi:hypothetical protein EK21DRAFT_32037, partial [Setomelanomma holmii]